MACHAMRSGLLARSLRLTAAATVLLGSSLARADGLPGTLDPTFGTPGTFGLPSAGLVGFSTPSPADFIDGIALQPDGKVVAIGLALHEGRMQLVLQRWDSAGSLDPTFGAGGRTFARVGGVDDKGASVLRQPDGKLVVFGYGHADDGTCAPADIAAGQCCRIGPGTQGNCRFAVARFDADGHPDPAFGGGTGGVLVPLGDTGNSRGFNGVVQPDGKIVVTGWALNGGRKLFALVRLTPAGDVDETFGEGGSWLQRIGDGDSEGHSMLRTADGRLVAVGQATVRRSASVTETVFAAVRYNEDGKPDATFGAGGVVTTPVGSTIFSGKGTAFATGAVEQTGGKLVVTGWADNQIDSARSFDAALVRYLPDGNIDRSFGSAGTGIVLTSLAASSMDLAYVLLAQADGKLLVAGHSLNCNAVPPTSDFMLLRYTADGAVDPTFGARGDGRSQLKVTPDGNAIWFNAALQADGRIVTLGSVGTPSSVCGFDGPGPKYFALGRFFGGPICGNGSVETSEGCDDGNVLNGDCCSAGCQVEGAPTVCQPSTNSCIHDDHCDGNLPVCRVGGPKAPGTPDCFDDDVCTIEDVCDGAGGCVGKKVCAVEDVTALRKGYKLTCAADEEITCTVDVIVPLPSPALAGPAPTVADGTGEGARRLQNNCPLLPPSGASALKNFFRARNTTRGLKEQASGDGVLKFRRAVTLKLNRLGVKLLKCGDVQFDSRVRFTRRAAPIDVQQKLPLLKALLRKRS